MKIRGEKMQEQELVEKVIRSMTCGLCNRTIEESNNVETLSIDELQGSLLVHEQNMEEDKGDEQVLKLTSQPRTQGRSRGNYRGGRGKGDNHSINKNVECYNYGKKGHYQSECPDWDEKANYAEDEHEEPLLLMALIEEIEEPAPSTQETREVKVWFLDSGCSNHVW